MGNSVADFKGDRWGYRDRQDIKIFDSGISSFWSSNGTQDRTVFAAGSASRCVDTEHPGYHSFQRLRGQQKQLRNIDIGSPFALERVSMTMPQSYHTRIKVTPTVNSLFDGILFPSVDYKSSMQSLAKGRFPTIPADLGTDIASMWGLGSTAIARSLPNVPQFSLFRFVGELKEGLPKIPLKTLAKERKLRNVGGEYLNVQFGLMPTASDVQKLVAMCMKPELRAHIRRRVNEEHRVRKTLSKGKTWESRPLTGTELTVMPATYSSGITGTIEHSREFRVWSSISFAYIQLQNLNRLLDDLDKQLGGFGVVPTAIDIWNLIPWSWFVDWFVNFNHVITNLSYLGRDGLYMQRGYVMAHYIDRTIVTQRRTLMGTDISTRGELISERKYRVKACPFGFGYTWKDFSPFQLSILAALGTNRMRF